MVPPELVCEPGLCVHEKPGPVLDFWIEAQAAGWVAQIQHSRSVPMYITGKQGAKVEDFWSVRFRRGGWGGYAVRRGASWDSVCVTGAALPPFLALKMTDLRTWLADPERDPSWYQEIRDRVAAQKARQKAAAKARQAAGTKRIDHAL